jgi:hypothetical protein
VIVIGCTAKKWFLGLSNIKSSQSTWQLSASGRFGTPRTIFINASCSATRVQTKQTSCDKASFQTCTSRDLQMAQTTRRSSMSKSWVQAKATKLSFHTRPEKQSKPKLFKVTSELLVNLMPPPGLIKHSMHQET